MTITLDQAKRGQKVEIVDIDGDENCCAVLKMGISMGHKYHIEQAYKRGPVVLGKGYSHIAIGNSIAKGIRVKVVPS